MRAASVTDEIDAVLRLGVCLCALAVTGSVVIAVFSHHDSGPPINSSTSSSTRRGVNSLSSNAFEKALQRHKQAALSNSYRSAAANARRRPTHSAGGGIGAMIRKSFDEQVSRRRSTTVAATTDNATESTRR